MLIHIESKVVTDNPTLAAFYYFVRSKDSQGKGWINLSMEDLMQFFNKKRRTIYGWCKQAVKIGFLHRFEIVKDSVFVQYVAKKIVMARTEGAMATTTVTLEILKQVNSLKAKAYEAALIKQQNACRYKVGRNSTLQSFEPKKNHRSSLNVAGCDAVSLKGNKSYFVRTRRTAIGASQTTVSLKLNRSRQTVLKFAKTIPHVNMFQGVTETNRQGSYYTYTKVVMDKGYPVNKDKTYRRAPSYYFSDLKVKPEQSLEVNLKLDYYKTEVKITETVKQKEDITHIITSKELTSRTLEEKIYKYLNVDKVRTLANAILLHFRGMTLPSINTTRLETLVQMIVSLDKGNNAMSKDEFNLVKLMVDRLINKKPPLPLGTKQGDLLTHLTSKSSSIQTTKQYKQWFETEDEGYMFQYD